MISTLCRVTSRGACAAARSASFTNVNKTSSAVFRNAFSSVSHQNSKVLGNKRPFVSTKRLQICRRTSPRRHTSNSIEEAPEWEKVMDRHITDFKDFTENSLDGLKIGLGGEIGKVRGDVAMLEANMAKNHADMMASFASVEATMAKHHAEMKSEMAQNHANMETRIDEMARRLTVKMVAVWSVTVAAIQAQPIYELATKLLQ